MSDARGDWWCPSCKEALVWQRVTYEERCDTCGTSVVWVDADTGTCSNCDRLKAEIERLRGIVDKLPKTADGVPVVPGMKVYVPAAVAGYWGQKPGNAVEFMVDWFRSESIHLVFIQGQTYQILANRCYSSRKSAEEASE